MWPLLVKLEPVISWIVIAFIFVWVFYAGMIRPVTKPTPTTTQNGGTAYNYTIHIGMGGCARIPQPSVNDKTAVATVKETVVK
jgi:hypothetical protein